MAGGRHDAFVGREAELDELGTSLRRARVVSVTGPPGVGKSALVRRWAEVASTRKLPAVVVALAGATTALAICERVAEALRLPRAPNAPAQAVTAQVTRALSTRGPVVLVLDDADAGRPHLARLAPLLLDAARDVRLVVTTRASAGVAGEARLDLAPLDVPDEADAAAERTSAVRFFVVAAARARPGYELPPRAVPAVARIVRRVDGLPLAIELCAARAAVLSEEEIDAMLEAREGLLGSSSARRVLASTLSWSWEQLAAEEASLLARCAVFRGSFDLEAALAVSGPGAARLAVVEDLARLEAAALVRARGTAPGEGASRRYAIPELVRAYVEERTDEAVAEEAARRHAAFYGTFATRRPAPSTEALALERENLEAAYRSASARGDMALAGSLLVALRPLALARGPIAKYLTELDRTMAAPRLPRDVLARLALARGLARIFRGRRDEALVDLARARDLARRAKLVEVLVLATSRTGLVRGLRGEARVARALLEDALERAERDGAPALRAAVHKDFGNVLSELGEDEEALDHLGRARDLFHETSDTREEGFVLMMAASRLVDRGELEPARRDLEAALVLLRAAADSRSETWTLALLALALLEGGAHAAARAHLERALDLVKLVGDEHTEGLVHTFLGHLALEQGLWSEAEASYREARLRLARAGDHGGEALATAAAAIAEAELGRSRGALATCTRAERLAKGDARAPRRRAVAMLAAGARLRAAPAASASKARGLAARALAEAEAEETTEELRFATRALRRLLGGPEGAPAGRAREGGGDEALVVARDGAWIVLPNARKRVELGRAAALRRLVHRLAVERLRYPGRPVSPRALVAAGWPDERILPAAAKNRLHVSVARLRRVGLGDLLLHREEGYLLDPAVPARLGADDDAGL